MEHLYEKVRKDLLIKSTSDDKFKRGKKLAEFAQDVKVDLSNFFSKDVIVVSTVSKGHSTSEREGHKVRIAIYNVMAFIRKKIEFDGKVFSSNTIKSSVYAAFKDSDKTICVNPNGGIGVNKYYCSCPDFRFRFANQILLPAGQLFYPEDNIKKGYSEKLKNSYERTKKDVIDKNGKVHYVDKDIDADILKRKGWRELTSAEKKELSKKRQANPENKGALCKHLLKICNIGDKENIYWVNKIVSNIYKLFKMTFIGKSKEEQVELIKKFLGIEIDSTLIPDFDKLITNLNNNTSKTIDINVSVGKKVPTDTEDKEDNEDIKSDEDDDSGLM